ncbi:hypothetical protein [Actinomadura sp. B10D3]|uniref:hypothetical protein n=1 Tax=Actinomadura sp. B10D3 TaxID=3153557 RepID=UPI00325EDC04
MPRLSRRADLVDPPGTRVTDAGHTALPIACAATFTILVDYTAPMTTLPATMVALDGGSTGQVWALNGMPLGLAGFLLVAGRLADHYGRKRLYVIGMATLVLATVLRGSFVAERSSMTSHCE